MKKNKQLQKHVNDTISEYRNDEFLNKLKENVSCDEKRNRNNNFKRYLLVGVSAFVALVAVVLVVAFAIPLNRGDNTDVDNTEREIPVVVNKTYANENRQVYDADIDEINEVLSGLELSSENLRTASVIKDTYYNEILYYFVMYVLNDELDTINFYIDVNPDFDYALSHYPFDKQYVIKGLAMDYYETVQEGDGIFCFSDYAQIIKPEAKIFIEYDGVGIEEQSNFISFIDEIIN